MALFLTFAAFVCTLFASGCASTLQPICAPGEELSVNELIYFGTAKPTGVVTHEEWAAFLSISVTPRFPQGLTVWHASGQWRGADGSITHEDSFVLNLVHPDDNRSEALVRAIAAEYKSRFGQESVHRVKSHACASF